VTTHITHTKENIMSDLNTIQKSFADMAEQFKTMAEQYTPKAPEVKFNKNGYEIRTSVLEMAKQFTEFEHSMKFAGWETSVERDETTGQVVSKVEMPNVPGVEQVLDTAEKFYEFINKK